VNWHDYIRGFEDGQQDKNSESSTGTLLLLFILTRTIISFVLTISYAVLKGLVALVRLVFLLIKAKVR
jgi:hypothetical protein